MKTFLKTLVRWCTAVGLLGLAIHIVRGTEGQGIGAMGAVTVGVAFLVMGGLLFFPEGIRLFVSPLTKLAEGLYFPGGKLDKPVLSYTLPEFYRKQHRYPEALERYDFILDHYPRELRAWLGAIDVLALHLKDWPRAQRYRERAERKLRHDPEALATLDQHWRIVRDQGPSLPHAASF